MADNVTLTRVIDLVAQDAADSSVYALIDSETGGTKKYPIGNLANNLADSFDSSATYSAGDYVLYGSKL